MKTIRKPVSILLSLLLIISVFTIIPFTANAAEVTVSYVNAGGEDMGTKTCTRVVYQETTWSDGWYAVASNVICNSRFYVNGTVNLILKDGYYLHAFRWRHASTSPTAAQPTM